MKELSIEGKAKAYDELKVKARQIYNKENDVLIIHTIEDLFPELMESEDEKVRKEMLMFFKNYSENGTWKAIPDVDEWIAWLKKQVEQKPVEWHREDEQNLNGCLGYIRDEYLRRWLKDAIHAKYDKPADKVEPKFKAGDWVVNVVNGDIYQVINTEGSLYIMKHEDVRFTLPWKKNDDILRAWNIIEDAKDGDVLVYPDGTLTLFRYRLSGLDAGLYMAYIVLTDKIETKQTCVIKDVKPATKEQREALFSKMEEAGYEWDDEEKRLEKMEDDPAWTDRDESFLKSALSIISYSLSDGKENDIETDLTEWLKGIKERIR